MGKINKVTAEYARLMVKVETTKDLSEDKFKLLVSVAVKEFLGTCGPNFKVDYFDSSTRKGSVVAAGSDIQLIWAALSCFGQFYKERIAVHFNALTEYDQEF